MKGQMVFEFIIAAVLFFAVILYVVNYLNTAVYGFSADFYTDSLHTTALQISELLLKNQGILESGVPVVVGLASDSGWPVLSSAKIGYLKDYCESSYTELVHQKLGLEANKNMAINITQPHSASPIMDCKGAVIPEGVTIAHIKRFVLSESNEVLTIDVWVW